MIAETAFPLNKHIRAGYFPKATSHVTPGPIVLPNCHRMQRVGARPLRVGFIGLHDPAKGIETLAAAAQKLAADTELKIEFLIAGDGPANYTQKLINLFPSTARFTGWIRPADFYPIVDVVVVPSVWHEPFGRVSAEAMSFGVPVVTARSGGLVENIVEGTSGLSFAAGDSVELYRILRRLALDDALVSRLAAGALRRAQRFKVDRVAMDLGKFLAETCEKKLSGDAIAAE